MTPQQAPAESEWSTTTVWPEGDTAVTGLVARTIAECMPSANRVGCGDLDVGEAGGCQSGAVLGEGQGTGDAADGGILNGDVLPVVASIASRPIPEPNRTPERP